MAQVRVIRAVPSIGDRVTLLDLGALVKQAEREGFAGDSVLKIEFDETFRRTYIILVERSDADA